MEVGAEVYDLRSRDYYFSPESEQDPMTIIPDRL